MDWKSNRIAQVVILLLVSRAGAAWMIGNLPEDRLAKQSCRILMSQPRIYKTETSYVIPQVSCSATVIGKSLIATSAHCFEGKQFTEGTIRCPNDVERKVVNWTIPSDYRTPAKGMQAGAATDLAVARIEGAFKVEPVVIPKASGDLTWLHDQTSKGKNPSCGIYGYGDPHIGEHNGRSVQFEKWRTAVRTYSDGRREPVLDWWRPSDGSFAIRAEVRSAVDASTPAVGQGDSGGGLLCEIGGRLVLVGVIEGFSTRIDALGDLANVASVVPITHRLGLLRDLISRRTGTTVTGVPTEPLPTTQQPRRLISLGH